MAKKYYAVKQGYKPGIYNTWDECKKQIHGFSGASYKSFPTLEEAKAFAGIDNTPKKAAVPAEVVAYVDGSYQHSKREFSYGLVIFINGGEEHYAGKYNTANLVEMRNVAGEIVGAQKAMEYCLNNNISSMDLYYDYEGISKWCTGEWKTNKEGTKAYKSFYDSIKERLSVNFIKVMGHSGDKYNDLADELAKSALGLANLSYTSL